MKRSEEVMEILEAYDLTGSLRGAVALCGCDHKTVSQWVRARDAAGGQPRPAGRSRPVTGAFLEKVEELVDRSHGKIRADKAHERLVAMGYLGSGRSTRRAVAEANVGAGEKLTHLRRLRIDPPWAVAEASGVLVSLARLCCRDREKERAGRGALGRASS